MAQEVSTLSAFRIGKLTERVAMLERALIEREAERRWWQGEAHMVLANGQPPVRWNCAVEEDTDHYRTLAENELIREGLVRPRNVREMEASGKGQKEG